MKKRKNISLVSDRLSEQNALFLDALHCYEPELLEVDPLQPQTIYAYYTHVDALYIWLKNAYNHNLYMLCNEIRAMLGHLAEYDEHDPDLVKNLDKAYGHFRRLSIDTLKVLCNGLDQFFDEWIQKHAIYDYSNIDNEFLPEYVSLYRDAHIAYLDVQKTESLGTDKKNKIIVKYYDVAEKYAKLFSYHMSKRRQDIEKKARRFKINKVCWWVATVFITTLSILGSFL